MSKLTSAHFRFCNYCGAEWSMVWFYGNSEWECVGCIECLAGRKRQVGEDLLRNDYAYDKFVECKGVEILVKLIMSDANIEERIKQKTMAKMLSSGKP